MQSIFGAEWTRFMTVIALLVIVLAMLGFGLVLFRSVARWVSTDAIAVPAGIELLLIGPLPGLALVALLFTLLALLHLLRAWFIAPLALSILLVLRRDTAAVLIALGDAMRAFGRSARQGDLFPLGALLIGVIVIYVGLLLCLVPRQTVDIWVYHVPLAQSIATHSGFVYPQIPHLLYASQPSVLELLHGAGMLFLDHFAIASAINLAIYLGLVLLLLSFVKRARGFQFLVLCYLFVWDSEFYDVVSPMIDAPRSCLSLAAFLFAYRYACNSRRLDLVISALMAGFAVAAKVTELITPALICATLVPLIWRRGSWRDLLPAAAAFTAISSYWYVKNLILYANPIYPFLFRHPGLSDAWMRQYLSDITRPFDVADRGYSTNLLSLRGWHDFFVVMRIKFSSLRSYAFAAALGLVLPLPRRWMLPLWSLLLFIIWYAAMFNSARWAMTAVMLLMIAGFLTFAFVVDRLLDAWAGESGNAALTRLAVSFRSNPVGRRLSHLASAALILFLTIAGTRLAEGHGQGFYPPWMKNDNVMILVRSGSPEKYLAATRPGYEIYHLIAQRNLGRVFQPYDNGAAWYVSAYNDGRPSADGPSDLIIFFRTMPANLGEVDQFLARNRIHYFIQPQHIDANVQLLGADHIARANQVIADVKPHSRLLLTDRFGNDLYEILPKGAH